MIPVSIAEQLEGIARTRETLARIASIGWCQYIGEVKRESTPPEEPKPKQAREPKPKQAPDNPDNSRTSTPCTPGPKARSGFAGVERRYTLKFGNRFTASITLDGKKRMIGIFDTPEQAHEAFKRAHVELHGTRSRYWGEV